MTFLVYSALAVALTGCLARADALSPQPMMLSIRQPNVTTFSDLRSSVRPFAGLSLPQRDKECPPCFNCQLPAFNCLQFGECNPYDGQCRCPEGFGGQNCSEPLCGSLADGNERYPRTDGQCECPLGWTGINCNVCQTDEACVPLVAAPDRGNGAPYSYLPGSEDAQRYQISKDASAEPPKPGASNGAVCYKGGYTVNRMHQMCDVTNRKILDMLPDRAPQVTFTCDNSTATCGFQFWIGQLESFYCGLRDCQSSIEIGYDVNTTDYRCQEVECSCIAERMLCGEDGSVDISDFLTEEIRGPGRFSCKSDGSGCKFEEPAMNNLINDIFGDSYITLNCESGECMHYSQVPGFRIPDPPDNSALVAFSIAFAGLLVVGFSLLFWYLGRAHKHPDYLGRGTIQLPEDETDKLMSEHIPAALHFADLTYTVNGKTVLSGVCGSVKPGQLLAIVGASGAGKSTFLDILAKKDKRGTVSGTVLVNGRTIPDNKYKRIIGYVDQEDTLMSTLTVYETVFYSAQLRLPREMSLAAKRLRTLETMHELGILSIRDSRIGETGKRSISGGEKRRVSIACELVTSPSVLFLDEPTSGLDAYNAFNVVDCLSALARNYNRTVIFTIHQPRSNIISLFDQLLLLAKGRTVYSGSYDHCQAYFESIGHACPPGYNLADFLIDLTSRKDDTEISKRSRLSGDGDDAELDEPALTSRLARSQNSNSETQRQQNGQSVMQTAGSRFSRPESSSPRVQELVDTFSASHMATAFREELSTFQNAISSTLAIADGSALRDLEIDSEVRGYRKAGLWTQFTILSGRAFKNLYRNPMLMLSHYVLSVVLALVCAFLFRNVTDDIPGFQNRMGLFFFVLALFGFSCLTSLTVFANERILFMRERSNGYYSPFTYFTAKVLFDILPLRVVPPFILGAIIYRPVGLVPTVTEFWNFILILVLFNLVASSVVLFISIVISDNGVANLVGSLVMLFNLLFAGLLINRDKVPQAVGWLQTISFFHAAFESLLVNELRYLQLKDHRYGVDIEVPSATILSMFGFRASQLYADAGILLAFFVAFTAASLLALQLLVKEKR